MKKAMFILCLLACFSLLLCSCGGGKTDAGTGEPTSASATVESGQPTSAQGTETETPKVTEPADDDRPGDSTGHRDAGWTPEY